MSEQQAAESTSYCYHDPNVVGSLFPLLGIPKVGSSKVLYHFQCCSTWIGLVFDQYHLFNLIGSLGLVVDNEFNLIKYT